MIRGEDETLRFQLTTAYATRRFQSQDVCCQWPGMGYEITLAADAHTTHDKPHAPATVIIAHHNATQPNIRSFGVKIAAVPVDEVVF